MDTRDVCILGGSGFVGRALADQLAASGRRVRLVTRNTPRAMSLTVLPTVELWVADPHDPASLVRAFDNMDVVVNLVGVLHDGRGDRGFAAAHAGLPAKVVDACHQAGVQQLLHMSALGAGESAPSEYQRTKARGEAAIRERAGALPWTIFRPSVIFGEGDGFLNLFASLVKMFPVLPLGSAGARFQPIWVEDVARAFVWALGESRAFGQAYELAGPRSYTLAELVAFVGATVGHEPRILPLPGALASLQAFAFEHLPGKLLTRDNLRSMSVDNVATQPFPPVFGFTPAPLEAVVPGYMAARASRARYSTYRNQAGR